MTPMQALETLEGVQHHGSLGEAGDVLRDVLRRDWSNRVLDEEGSYMVVWDGKGYITESGEGRKFGNRCATRAEARYTAAVAVWTDLKKILTDEQIAVIGECP